MGVVRFAGPHNRDDNILGYKWDPYFWKLPHLARLQIDSKHAKRWNCAESAKRPGEPQIRLAPPKVPRSLQTDMDSEKNQNAKTPVVLIGSYLRFHESTRVFFLGGGRGYL